MTLKSFAALVLTMLTTAGCGEPVTPPLPPLLEGATTKGGNNFLCQPDGGSGSTPGTAAYSPEIVERLKRGFPAGTPAAKLRSVLKQQGFSLHDRCSPDGSVSWAEFRQRGGNGITTMSALGTVFWKEDQAGLLVWTTGDISFSGL